MNSSGRLEAAPARHLRVERHRRRDRGEHHRRHHHHPHPQKPAESPKVGAGPAVHPGHLLGGRPPGEAGQREQQRDEPQPRPHGGESPQASSPRPARTVECGGLPPRSGCPRELRRGEGGLPLILDAEGVDLRARRVCHRQLGAGGMEDAGELRGLAALHAEWHDVLDLEVHGVADADRVAAGRPPGPRSAARSTPRFSATSGPRASIGPPSAPENTAPSFSACSSEAAASMNTPRRQLPSLITFGVSATAATVRPLTSVPSTSPSGR